MGYASEGLNGGLEREREKRIEKDGEKKNDCETGNST